MPKLVGPHIHAQELTATATPRTIAIGTRASDDEGNEYIYLVGIGSCVAGSWVTYDELGVTALLAAGAKGPVAVAMAALTAGLWGWFQIFGKVAAALTCSPVADNAIVGFEHVDGNGYVGDGHASPDEIYGAICRGVSVGASPAAKAVYQIYYPFVDFNKGKDA